MNCPNCGTSVPARELLSGWCETCGKRIPAYAGGPKAAPPGAPEIAHHTSPPRPAPPPRKKSYVGPVIILSLTLIGLLVGGYFLIRDYQDSSRKRKVVKELMPLFENVGTSQEAANIPLRESVFVWNCKEDEEEKQVWNKVASPKQARGGSASMSVILILDWDDKYVDTYTNGEDGYQRKLIVGVATWPEKKVLGKFVIEGETPGMFIVRKESEKGPIIGDTIGPLKRWITAQEIRN